MNPLQRLKQAWIRNAGTIAFSRRTHDPKTETYEVVTYLAEPIPGTDDYDVTVRIVGSGGPSEYKEVWDRERLVRTRERVTALRSSGQ